MADLASDLAALKIDREPESASSRTWVLWLVLLSILAAGGFLAWRSLRQVRPLQIQAATVTMRAAGTQAAVLNASGYVTARRRATVSSKVTGKVIEVNVEEGMAVREGQILARLDDATARAGMALAEAQVEASRRAVVENEVRLTEATLQLGRVSELRRRGLATASELDGAQAAVDSTVARIAALRQQVAVAERQLDLQRTELDNMVIRAPFSGVAISKDAQPGEMVSPVSAGGGFTRTGISTIVDMRSLEIEVEVNESYINRVSPQQAVTAVLDAYPDWSIPGRVITTIPAADRQKATVLVRIAFDRLDPRILPDMGIKVTFLRAEAAEPATARQPTTLVPKSAIRTDAGVSVAFVIRGAVVERRAVQLGGADGERLEVRAGLQAGDRVVLSPPASLVDGATVVVQP
jgi:RND family efflux transporter MFP subunit